MSQQPKQSTYALDSVDTTMDTTRPSGRSRPWQLPNWSMVPSRGGPPRGVRSGGGDPRGAGSLTYLNI
jgi:hypothetical protein